MPDSPEGRCIYNLRLIHTTTRTGIEIHCWYECNGSNKVDRHANPCDFYTDSADYLNEKCAWHIRAKRIADKLADEQEESGKLMHEDEVRCLKCSATIETNCQGYVNVKHVIDEICAHKVEIENNKKRGKNISDLETNCDCCTGKSDVRCCDNYCSMRDLYDFQRIFLPKISEQVQALVA